MFRKFPISFGASNGENILIACRKEILDTALSNHLMTSVMIDNYIIHESTLGRVGQRVKTLHLN